MTHAFAPLTLYGPLSRTFLTDWCGYWPDDSDEGTFCGRLAGDPAHAGSAVRLPSPPRPLGYLGRWPPVCQRCSHRHADALCADHVWTEACPYDAGAECTTAGPRAPDNPPTELTD